MKKLHTDNHYYWRGVNLDGELIHGKIYASSQQEVITQLTEQKIKIRYIKPTSALVIWKRKSVPVKAKEVTLFTRQLATMLNAGLPLSMSLNLILNNQQKASCKDMTSEIKNAVEEGVPLSVVLNKIGYQFDEIYVSLVACAELSGQLGTTFNRIANYREKEALQKAKQIKALIYPFVVILLAFSITYLMLTTVIPEFEKMFASFNAPLPWFTQQIISLSKWLSAHAFHHLLSLFFLAVIFKLLLKSARVGFIIDKQLTLFPLIGPILTKAIISRYSATLSVAIRSGIPVAQAIMSTANVTGNLYFKQTFERMFEQISNGQPIYVAMKQHRCFPGLMIQMVMVGEQTGQLDLMLDKVSDIYTVELDQTMEKLGVLIEPFLIVFLGLVIGGLVVAIYLPIFKMMNILG
ncbi:type II secretion system F family protein [Vibrio sp. TH_r3]|uniref:type II secretion system F family protein n=1 Tax=Vibrio sp. TH_r3 TaxID=3082084 RepID=UPI002953250A|nr:type II secretion system F family protein [Vibrio sp. TH_r3]MDV7104463.1 type II secretion system F family protein [Vibrio sp. TH_r3]